jgi:diguanylate cyclase (GGDEF)-like protein
VTAGLPQVVRRSVRNRLVAVVLLVSLAAIVLAALVNLQIHRKTMERELLARNMEALQEAQNQLLRLSRQAETTVRLLAGLDEIRSGVGRPDMVEHLESMREVWFLGLVEVFDAKGVRVAQVHSGDARALDFATAKDDPGLANALNLLGSTDFSPTPAGLCIKAFAPVLAPGTLGVAGVVAVSFPVDSTQLTAMKDLLRADFALHVAGAKREESTFTDVHGGRLEAGIDLPEATRLAGPLSMGLKRGPGGEYAIAVAPLLDNRDRPVATLAALMSDTGLRARLVDTARFVLAAVGLALLLALGLGWLFADSFTLPIRQMHEAVAALAHGRLDSRVDIRQEDELGLLAAGFNDMAASMEASRNALARALEIKESYARELEVTNDKLAQFNQELESTVEARTGELSQRNRALIREIEERHHAERRLRESEQRFMDILEFLPDATFVIDKQGRIIAWNRAIEELTGYAAPQMIGRGDFEYSLPIYGVRRPAMVDMVLTGSDEHERLYPGAARVGHALRADITATLRSRELHLSVIASPLFNSENEIIGAIESIRDVTEGVRAQRKLTHHALHDILTGLANRALFTNRLEHALRRARRNPDFRLAVLLLDLDRFKQVNDTLGHLAGDALLTTVARRLEAVVRETDTVARLGGDEFVILLDGIASPRDGIHIAGRILEDVRHPVHVGGHDVFTSASIGVVFSGGEYGGTEDILRDADIAMYRAKDMGRGRYKVFHSGLRKEAMRQMTMEAELRRGLDLGLFTLLYQPIFELESGRLAGFEALLRWMHETRGLLKPAEFMAAAEESGLILPLGDWSLGQACRDAALWRAAGADVPVHVNLSARQFSQGDLVERVSGALTGSSLSPGSLLLEITEGELAGDPRQAARRLMQLREQGVRVALDDFGTGFSSLSYLQQYPIDMLKVDRSFVARMQESGGSRRIVQSIVSLGAGLGMTIVAEGVEQEEQRLELLTMGCRLGQGYLFARPLPIAAALELVRQGQAERPDGN